MKNIYYKIVILALLATPAYSSIEIDKYAHFGAAFILQTSCVALLKQKIESKLAQHATCFLTVNALGATKEFLDPYTGGHRELDDLAANGLGSGLAIGILSIGF